MVTVIKAKRKSAISTPSSLACLSVMPTINLTVGCLHDCAYCYIRGYSSYPGDSRIILYEDTLERLRNELRRRNTKPHAIYFSPSSDLFQPAPEVLELSHAVFQFLFCQGIGVAFLTKGHIPDDTLHLIMDHAELVRAQVGLISLDERISRAFEPNAASPRKRLDQLAALIAGGVPTEARLDPILPALTDSRDSLNKHFAIQSSSNAEPQQALVANITGFAVFAVVMGVLANIAETDTVGGLSPGLFFFDLDF